jgi:exopolysaccharide production protein ExoQ
VLRPSGVISRSSVRADVSREGRQTLPLAGRVLTVLLAVTAAAPFPGSGPVVFGLALLSFGYAVLSWSLSRPHGTIVALLMWCALTVAWSVTPGQTVRGVLVTVASTLGVCSLAAQLSRAQVYRTLSAAMKILLVLSWLLYLAAPSLGREQADYHRGALTGVFVQRNAAAFVLAVAVLTFLFMAASPHFSGRLSKGVWAALALVTLVATESGTGLAVTGVCALLMVGVRRIHRWSRGAKQWLLVLVAGGAGALAVNAQTVVSVVTELLGRDATLTGRTMIWAVVEPYIRTRPWTGYGWGALWTKDSLMTRVMWSRAGFQFPHAHNAYLDVLVQCGIVGLVLIMLTCAAVLVKALVGVISGRDGVWPTWPMVTIICLLLYAISEQSYMGYFGWLVVVLASVLVRPDGSLDAAPSAETLGRPRSQ